MATTDAPETAPETAPVIETPDAAATPAPSKWASFVETAEEVQSGATKTLADIPADIVTAVKRSFDNEKKLRFRFPDKATAEEFVTLCREYAALISPRMTIRRDAVKAEDGTEDSTVVQFKAKPFEAREV